MLTALLNKISKGLTGCSLVIVDVDVGNGGETGRGSDTVSCLKRAVGLAGARPNPGAGLDGCWRCDGCCCDDC